MKKVLAIFFALSLMFLCSCGLINLPNTSKNPAGQTTSTASSVGQSLLGAPSASASAKPSPSETSTAKPSPSASASAKPTPSASTSVKPSPSQASSTPVPLDKADLAYFTEYFKDSENYGFLLSSYTKISDVDMKELFYTGAGIASDLDTIPKAEQDAFLKTTKMDEFWGDVLKMTAKQLNDFLKEKTGLSYTDFSQKLSWTYIDKYDAYYREVSDTNYCPLAAVSGTKTSDGTYVIQCKKSESYGQVDSCVVTLKKVGNHYLFVSNNAHMTKY